MAMRRGVTSGNNKKIVPGPFGGELAVPREITYTQKMFDALQQRHQETRIPVADQVRDFVTDGLVREAQGEEASRPDQLTVSGIEPADIKKFGTLAKQVIHIDEPETFARILINKALDMGPEVMREFIFGSSERILEAMKEENDARAGHEAERLNLPKPAASKARRAA